MPDYAELPNFLTTDEARAILRVGRSAFLEMIYTRQIPAFKCRGRWRIPKQQFLDRLEAMARERCDA